MEIIRKFRLLENFYLPFTTIIEKGAEFTVEEFKEKFHWNGEELPKNLFEEVVSIRTEDHFNLKLGDSYFLIVQMNSTPNFMVTGQCTLNSLDHVKERFDGKLIFHERIRAEEWMDEHELKWSDKDMEILIEWLVDDFYGYEFSTSKEILKRYQEYRKENESSSMD